MKTDATVQEASDYSKIYKALGNQGRLQTYLYLKRAGVATNSIIAKNLGMNRSVVSRYTAELIKVNLVLREKWFTSIVFKVNPDVVMILVPQVRL